MRRLVDLIGMSAAGWVGWVAGEPWGFFVAFILSIIGTGAGLYATRRFITRHLP